MIYLICDRTDRSFRLLLSLLACYLLCFIKNRSYHAISCFQGRLLSASQTPVTKALTIIISFFNTVHDSLSFNYQFWCCLQILYTFFHLMNQLFSKNKRLWWLWTSVWIHTNVCVCVSMSVVIWFKTVLINFKGSTSKHAFIIRNAWIYLIAKVQGRWNLMLLCIMQTGRKKN